MVGRQDAPCYHVANRVAQEVEEGILRLARLLLHRLIGKQVGLLVDVPSFQLGRRLLLGVVAHAELVDDLLSQLALSHWPQTRLRWLDGVHALALLEVQLAHQGVVVNHLVLVVDPIDGMCDFNLVGGPRLRLVVQEDAVNAA